jgi:hypothetical protein
MDKNKTRKLSVREKFWWFIHNMIAHPLSEILYWLWMDELGVKLHDWTVPKTKEEDEK